MHAYLTEGYEVISGQKPARTLDRKVALTALQILAEALNPNKNCPADTFANSVLPTLSQEFTLLMKPNPKSAFNQSKATP